MTDIDRGQLPTIVAAAVKAGELVISIPKPGRHHHIVHTLPEDFKLRGIEQGFLASDGRFYGRASARQLVIDNHQPLRDAQSLTHRRDLFSEDLW